MLTNDDFIAWANENIVSVVGHDGAVGGKEDHKPTTEKDPKTKEEREVCPTYAGLTCAEHQALRRAFSNPPDGWGKIGQAQGVPNHWAVGPDGSCEQVENKDAGVAKSLIEALTARQKAFEGKPLPYKRWEGYQKLFADGDKAAADGKWKAALAAYLKVEADGKKLTTGLAAKVAEKLAGLEERVTAAFHAIRDGDAEGAAKLKAVRALRAEIGQKAAAGLIAPAVEIDAWLKEQAAAK